MNASFNRGRLYTCINTNRNGFYCYDIDQAIHTRCSKNGRCEGHERDRVCVVGAWSRLLSFFSVFASVRYSS